jgi:DNA-binding response OmpR family regulator
MEKKTPRVLIIEDELPLFSALESKLGNEGFEVLSAKNGKTGLETALREHPDVILLDIVMPVMDGMTMLTKLREDAWGKEAQVIILTNLSDNEMIKQSFERGAHDYLIKSDWRLDDVVARIRQKLEL